MLGGEKLDIVCCIIIGDVIPAKIFGEVPPLALVPRDKQSLKNSEQFTKESVQAEWDGTGHSSSDF